MLHSRASALGWRVVELKDKPHRYVARVFKQAAIHVNVNCQESFNATVPEAMAAGCIPICYEAFGGKDYLRDGENACVLPTHHAYPLMERTLELMTSWDAERAGIGQDSTRRKSDGAALHGGAHRKSAGLVLSPVIRRRLKNRRSARSE